MNVLHSTQYYWPFIGGAEKYCQEISEGLASGGVKVDVFSSNVIGVNPTRISHARLEIHNNVTVRRLVSLPGINAIYGHKGVTGTVTKGARMFNALDTRASWSCAIGLRILTSSTPHYFPALVREAMNHDMVVAFNIITGMTALSFSAARAAKRPLIVFPMFHFGLESYERPSLYRMLRSASAVICSTHFERNELIRRGVEPRNAYVVYEGIDPPEEDKQATERLRDSSGLDSETFVVGYIGRRDFDKGYAHVLRAVATLARRGNKIKLMVAGYGSVGKELADYLSLVKDNAIIDLGVADEQTKLAAIACSNVVTLPSRAETYPIVFVESWFMGKPVIGAKIGSVASVVRENIDGFLVEFGDTEDLMKKILQLYKDRELATNMGTKAKERAMEEFRLSKGLETIREIYDDRARNVRNKPHVIA